MRLLFELGVEELPSRYVVKSEKALLENTKKLLLNNRIEVFGTKSYSSPRRLAIEIEMSDTQKDLDETKLGPAINIALKDGKPTKALLGFLASNGLKENEYSIIKTPKGEYVQISKFEKGKDTKEILAQILKTAINSLEFEKSMKWGSSQFRFIRPIKWILALVDNEVLDFSIEGIKASNITRGMREFGSQEILVKDMSKYKELLLENYVIADRENRKAKILENLPKNTEVDNSLLEEVTDLVEYPCIIVGEFNKNYLNLPEELITITMKTHQRYFPVRKEDGKLSNQFVVVRNAPVYSELVKLGNEKVIEPRLADSKFFFDEDLKINLFDNVEKLKNIMFQKDMGTIYEKMLRAKEIAKYLGADENTLRAIELSKADLVSNVINEKEFTSLQGMMGSIYAKNSKENDIVSNAIEEHYRPRFQGDDLPKSMEGAIAAISDKVDTGMGAFCVGLKPTSSKDPYAIRRAIQGVTYIALDKKLDISYVDLSKKAYEIFSNDKKVIYSNALGDFIQFFKQRLETVLSETYSKDLISYVINIETNFKNILVKLNKLNELSKTSDFANLINLLKRMKNMVKDNSNKGIDLSLIKDENEKNMINLIEKLNNNKNNFSASIDTLLENAKVINSYFDNVKINTDDEKITNNRYALLNNVLFVVGDIIEI
ncbi:glycine--tRNA ligase subunit beta [Oceanivirga salmonicida]|uniref:glycine--tRNA ligase subunit beta n=1 Tax=Oceanivirga salmonicida TaxID=1769291 RepID=UPI0008317C53|nr:glycine--tRNA ligase subunit beta [Oceanivirga salmonicida]